MATKKTKTNDQVADQRAGDKINDEIFELDELWKMKFRDPASGQIVKVRKAFKPRGKLEFYSPEN